MITKSADVLHTWKYSMFQALCMRAKKSYENAEKASSVILVMRFEAAGVPL